MTSLQGFLKVVEFCPSSEAPAMGLRSYSCSLVDSECRVDRTLASSLRAHAHPQPNDIWLQGWFRVSLQFTYSKSGYT